MSPKCAVPPLHETTLTVVARQLIDALTGVASEEDVSLPFALVTSYYETLGATTDIYQDLLNLILNSDFLDPSIRYFAMRLLLKDNVKNLATGIFPCPFYQKVLEVIIEQGQGLTALNLKGVWVKEEHLSLMYILIKTLTNLTVLNIPYIANDEILKYIGENNKVLKLLDVSGESDITEIGIHAMINDNPSLAESLSVVNIGMYGEENICHTDVALLIRGLPNLTNLGSYSFTGKSILHIFESRNLPADFKTKLDYIHDTKTDSRTMRAIVALCPELETVYLEEPEPCVLNMLKDLKKVNRLKLNKFRCHELHQLLHKIGHQINSLMLLAATGSFNITQIAETCRNIQMLECYQMETVTHEEEITFNKLEHVEILHANLTTSSLKYFLTASPQLKKIIVGDEIKMDDRDMARILLNHNLQQLDSVWFPNAPRLSSETVELMMERLPRLQSLGQLSGWRFTPDDMMLMKAVVASTNTDLVLSPLGVFP